MKALLFLYVRVFVNGVKRAFSTPMRMIGILIFIFYQLMWMPRMMFSDRSMSVMPTDFPKLEFPPIAVVDAVVFAGFCALTVIFALNLFNNRANFRAADVDVLFPTPIDPRLVLMLKVLRDVGMSLFAPLLLAVVFWRPAKVGWANLFSNMPNPESANSVFRVALVAYFLSAIAWVWIGHGASLAFSKPDVKTDRLRAGLGWGLFAALVVFIASGFMRISGAELPGSLIDLAHAPDFRAVFFLASAATNLTMAPISGNPVQAVAGASLLIGAIVAAVLFARSQTGWMYEQAAMRTSVTESTQRLRRSGDIYGIAARSAEAGRVKAGRVGRLQKLTVNGPWALVWKEVLVLKRTSLLSLLTCIVTSVAISVLVGSLPFRDNPEFKGLFLLGMQAMVLLGPAMGLAQAGFIESLRRIDLLKPLPFKSQTIVSFEVVNKTLTTLLALTIGLLTVAVLKPELAAYSLAGLLMFPGFTLALSAVSLLLVVLLPDIEDPTQRSFRGMATLLGIVTCTGPPIALFAVLLWMKVPVIVAALPTGAVMIALAWTATYFAGRVYEDFNPSE